MSSASAQNSLQRRSTESRLRQLEAESLQDTLPEGFSPSDSRTARLAHRVYYPLAIVIANLVLWSIFGVLARKGLQDLTEYQDSFLGGVIWANFVACFVMGLAVELQALFSSILAGKSAYSSKAAIPVYVGITTGFCGSCSSFSSFILEVFTKTANLPQDSKTLAYPTPGYGVLAFLEVILAHMGMSLFGLVLGKHCARAMEKRCPAISLHAYKKVELASCVLAVGVFVVVIVLLAVKDNGSWRSWMFSCFFAPFGTITRYWLSREMNQMVANFPMGTFVANIGACVLLAAFNVLVRGRHNSSSSLPVVSDVLSCHVLVGLDDGYCGCLSTVSTFTVELLALDLPRSYTYGVASISIGFVCMLLIAGSYNWTIGFTSQVC